MVASPITVHAEIEDLPPTEPDDQGARWECRCGDQSPWEPAGTATTAPIEHAQTHQEGTN